MPYPNDATPLPTNMQGTTLLADGTDDHSLMHREIGTALNAVTAKIGLPAGTPVLNQVMIGSGLGTANWSGTWNNATLGTATIGTSTITGGTANNQTLGTPTIVLGSDAQGDLLYRSSGGALARLGIGSSGQLLTTNGTTPSWGSPDGWIATSDTLTYASASSFTIAGIDRTTIYTVGTRVKFTNNSTMYYGVVASSTFSTNTTVTLVANNDYSIANSAITAPSYSYQVNPQGYPSWFNWTPANIAWDGTPPTTPTIVALFSIVGRSCEITVKISYSVAGSSNTQINFDGPIAPINTSSKYLSLLVGAINASTIDGFPSNDCICAVYSTTPQIFSRILTGSITAGIVWVNGKYRI